MNSRIFSLLLVVGLLPSTRLTWGQVPETVTFNEHIRPILSRNCFACHGFDAKQRKAELRLDIAENAYEERGGQFPIKPGDPNQSEVWNRIIADDPDLRMPPADSKKELTETEKELLKKWIEQGAPYQRHWAFEAPVKPAEPAVVNAKWARTPVDRFILHRLEQEGLAPQAEADKETLIRRVSFALTGLPPSVQEVDEFLNDSSEQSFENMVDRYLQSRHFGEEMARHWLDIARYADTHGLHLDNERQMWAYRDWVVQAFNDNLPFDEFTIWQLAGDQLPEPTPQQLTATGFNRCNVTTSEGGSIAPEFLYRYAVDRTSTMIETWMGLTGGCAVCHDHKFDPLSTKEFYSLYAFFYSAADPAMDGNISVTEPFLKLPQPGQQEALSAARAREREARAAFEQAVAGIAYQDPADVDPAPAKQSVTDTVWDDSFSFGASTRNTSRNAAEWEIDPAFGAPSGRRVLRQANGSFFENIIQPQVAPVYIPAQAVFRVWVRPDAIDAPQALAIVVATGAEQRHLVWGSASAFAQAEKRLEKGPMPPSGQWSMLEFTAADVGATEGQVLTYLSLQQSGGLVHWDHFTVTGESNPATDPLASFRVWWKGQAGKAPPEVPAELRDALKNGPDKSPDDHTLTKLKQFYLTEIGRLTDPPIAKLNQAYQEATAVRMAAEQAIPGTFIFRDVEQPREAFVMLRGQYDKPGEKVEPSVPAVLPPIMKQDPDARARRIDLARWLVSPEHPLTSRVAVNRLWQQLYGTGLVKTSSDFGTQGELPSHPQLLDWLAVHFRESGWDVKGMVRLLVTSATFRQASLTTPDVQQRDPANRLYARGPRLRLDAEQIRDNVLFASGLINLEVGGRGVRTYQPPNIWEPVGYSDSNTRYYLQDHGADLYRRSLYCFLKRTAPPPFMSNFDGPNREQACSRRERSNTPLQALQLMNDVQHFEAARNLAERAILHGGQGVEERIVFLFRTVLARRPMAEEISLVSDALDKQRNLFESDPNSAVKAIHVGESAPSDAVQPVELAAWTLVANLLLNLDETITRN